MKKAKKKAKRTTAQSSTKNAPVLSVGDRKKEILRDLLKGALFVVLVLAVKLGVEHTTPGKQIELLGYNTLQHQLSSQSVPVQVVDISELPASEITIDGVAYKATSRETLTKIIDAIAEQEPEAIGVDLDFSPDNNGYITPSDPDFFKYCLDRGLPIFLGIQRTQILPPDAWLNSEQYEKLAASITIPRQDTKKMPSWIQSGTNFKPGRTMSAALARAFGESHCILGNLLQRMGLAEQISRKEIGHGGSVGEFLVDYSPLNTLIESRTIAKSADAIRVQKQTLRNKIILIGDATPGSGRDAFVVSDRTESVPGVYVHACAAYTLAVAPLYELKWQGRVAIDALLSVSILLMITGIRLRFAAGPYRVATDRLQGTFTTLIVFAAVVFGVLFVRLTCVMWSDFILALGAIVLHPSIARRMENLWMFIRRVIRGLVLEQGEGVRK